MLKKISIILALTLALTAFAGCTGGSSSQAPSSSTPESSNSQPPQESKPDESKPEGEKATATDLIKAIESARSDEDNEYLKPISNDDAEPNTMLLELVGLNPDDASAYALSASMMNVKAYGVAIAVPNDAEAAKRIEEGFNSFVTLQKKNFENYLPDQFEIAKAGTVEVLESGEIVLVMCEDSDKVLEGIKTALK